MHFTLMRAHPSSFSILEVAGPSRPRVPGLGKGDERSLGGGVEMFIVLAEKRSNTRSRLALHVVQQKLVLSLPAFFLVRCGLGRLTPMG